LEAATETKRLRGRFFVFYSSFLRFYADLHLEDESLTLLEAPRGGIGSPKKIGGIVFSVVYESEGGPR
jgi:hypothetical protein